MKSTSELTDFYYKELYADLEELEKERIAVANKIKLYISIVAVITFIIAFFIGGLSDATFFILFAGVAVSGMIYKVSIQSYASNFKEKIIKPLIGAIDKNLAYHPTSHVSETLFVRSKIFSDYNRFDGNDLVKGEVNSTKIEFSDILAKKVTKSSKGQDSTTTIFQGLFIVAEFNKTLNSSTLVLPDKAEKMFGSMIGSWLQANNFSKNDLVKLDDPEFEKAFVIYSPDQIEARYILTHSLMQRILEYKKRSKTDISLSFNGDKLYMAIHYNKDLFEPAVFSSLLKLDTVMEYIQTLHLAISIIEELKLNEKLWSKR